MKRIFANYVVLLIGGFYIYNACAPLAKAKLQAGETITVSGTFGVRVEDNFETKKSRRYGALKTESGKIYQLSLPEKGPIEASPNSETTVKLKMTEAGYSATEFKSEKTMSVESKVSNPVSGPKRLLVVLVDFNRSAVMDSIRDSYATPQILEDAIFLNSPLRDNDKFFYQRTFSDQMRIASRGKVSFSGEVSRNTINIDADVNGECLPDEWIQKAEKELSNLAIPFSTYDHLALLIPTVHGCPWAGLAMTVPGNRTILNGVYNPDLLSHEVGHLLGMWHASYQYPRQEYGDDTDYMGQGNGTLLNLAHREQLDWVNRSQIAEFNIDTITAPVTYKITAHDLDKPNTTLGIKIGIGGRNTAVLSFRSETPSTRYWGDLSSFFGYSGVHLHYVTPTFYNDALYANTILNSGLTDEREAIIRGTDQWSTKAVRLKQLSHDSESVLIELSPYVEEPNKAPQLELFYTNRLNGENWSHLLEWHVKGADRVDLNIDNYNDELFPANGRTNVWDVSNINEIVATAKNSYGTTVKKIALKNIVNPPRFVLNVSKSTTTPKAEWCPATSRWCHVSVDSVVYGENDLPVANQYITACIRPDGGKYLDGGCARMMTDANGRVYDLNGVIWAHDLCVSDPRWFGAVFLGYESVNSRDPLNEYYPSNTDCF